MGDVPPPSLLYTSTHPPLTMTEQASPEEIRRTRTVQAPIDRAFALFTEELSSWWPSEYTWSKDTLDTIAIEPAEGGRCFERGPHGFECDWGRVLDWEPPRRLVFSWQISPTRVPEPNPEKASTVEIQFEADGPETTRIAFEHRDFANHGDGSAEYRAAMASPRGWDYILERYEDSVRSFGSGG